MHRQNDCRLYYFVRVPPHVRTSDEKFNSATLRCLLPYPLSFFLRFIASQFHPFTIFMRAPLWNNRLLYTLHIHETVCILYKSTVFFILLLLINTPCAIRECDFTPTFKIQNKMYTKKNLFFSLFR